MKSSTVDRIQAARLGLYAGSLLLILVSVALGTQTAKPAGANYEGKAFTFHRIQDDVYHAVGTGALTAGCNGAVIINPSDVLLVDSHITPAAAWALQEELKAITTKPIRFVVNTHFHFDHAHGNQAFPPGVEIVGHEFTRAMLASGASKTRPAYAFFVGTVPDRVATMKQQAAATTDPVERKKLEGQIVIQEEHIAASAAVQPTPPTVTLTDSMTIHRGGREIRLLFLGRGHTGGDVVVHLPRERLVMSGDLLTAGLAYLGDGYFADWITTLERLKTLEFDTVLPGHGQAFNGKAKVDHFQAYLRDFWSQSQAFHASGVSAEEAAKRIDLRKHSTNYPTLTSIGIMPHGVMRAYEILDGKVR
jgi:glyoxylase-like metal-dependent hydrolase (beta-lactamase superfamily II)